MKFAPYDKFTLASPYEKAIVIERLRSHVVQRRLFRFEQVEASFQGDIGEDGFKISRITRIRNHFKPVILGRFEPHFSGTKISVVQRLNIFASVFLALWMMFVILVGGVIALFSQAPPQERYLVSFLLVAVWVVSTLSFWWEARETKEDLSMILDATDSAA